MSESAEPRRRSAGSGEAAMRGDLIGVLYTRVESLVERYQAAQQRIKQLDGQLAERNRRIAELSKVVERSERLRRTVHKRIDGLIAQVERLEQARG